MGEKEPKAAHCTAAPTKTRTLKTSAKLWFGKSACGSVSPIYHLLASKTARVVEWQTRTFEGRMPKGMRVQVPPRAPSCCLRGNPESRVRYSMDEVNGHAGDRKNEGSFRINSFHSNDLVARGKRTGDAQLSRHQFCFRFLFVEFRLSKIACSWYKRRTYIPS